MKTIKVLTTGLMLFWAASVNVAMAQEDASIYGLEVSINNNVMDLSFYSTYELSGLSTIHFDFYDTSNNKKLAQEEIYYNPSRDAFDYKFGEPRLEQTSEQIKIYVSNADISYFQNKSIRMELYIKGYGYVVSNNLRAANMGNSNILTFFFELGATTLINEIENSPYDYSVKYILPSGNITARKPTNSMYIELGYIKDKLVYNKKAITIK